MSIAKSRKTKTKRNNPPWLLAQMVISIIIFSLLAGPAVADDDDADSQPFGATSIIIELTDNDIELQVFVDGFDWTKLQIFSPDEQRIFRLVSKKNIQRQGGLSELFFASEPTHYLEDEPNYDGTIEEFLARFPEGEYEIEGSTGNGGELEGEAVLTHDLPALPEILAPVSEGEAPPVIDPNNLVIAWEPVTSRFFGRGEVEIIEYQIILDQEDPEREKPWVDGKTRRALINLPASVTSFVVPPEFLLPNCLYAFEIIAIEVSGNSSISTGEFRTID